MGVYLAHSTPHPTKHAARPHVVLHEIIKKK